MLVFLADMTAGNIHRLSTTFRQVPVEEPMPPMVSTRGAALVRTRAPVGLGLMLGLKEEEVAFTVGQDRWPLTAPITREN